MIEILLIDRLRMMMRAVTFLDIMNILLIEGHI